MTWVGNGPMWVRLIKTERTKTNSAIVMRVKGMLLGLMTHVNAIKTKRAKPPKTKKSPTSYTLVLLSTRSVTGFPAFIVAYLDACMLNHMLPIRKKIEVERDRKAVFVE